MSNLNFIDNGIDILQQFKTNILDEFHNLRQKWYWGQRNGYRGVALNYVHKFNWSRHPDSSDLKSMSKSWEIKYKFPNNIPDYSNFVINHKTAQHVDDDIQ